MTEIGATASGMTEVVKEIMPDHQIPGLQISVRPRQREGRAMAIKKRAVCCVLTCAALCALLSGCGERRPPAPVQTEEPSVSAAATQAPTEPETQTAAPVTAPAATEAQTAAPETLPPAPETEAAEKTTAAEETTAAPADEVDLSIELPEANGVMEVSTDPENLFIRTVCEKKGIDASLLCAVYAVPQSGQNYVFEFYTADGRSKDDLRRVYLLTAVGDIRSVAAAKAGEKEKISAVENWFCMNVLIKEVIFPSIEDQLRR
ncbi:MAG: hypothetical protein IJJ85_06385 [Clostridia bacterium]|nr:hypothetical protein [Clostridia bacterium]